MGCCRLLAASLLGIAGCVFQVGGVAPGGARDGGAGDAISDASGSASDLVHVDFPPADLVGADLTGVDFATPIADLSTANDFSIIRDLVIIPDLVTIPDLALPAILNLSKVGPTQNAGPVDLTVEGLIDWQYWGSAQGDSKNIGQHRIGPLAGGGGFFSPDQPVFSWTDGTKTQMAVNQVGVLFGKGTFTFAVTPTDTTATLQVWCSEESAPTGTFTVAFDDNSAPSQNLVVPGNGMSITYIDFIVTFRSATAKQLNVSWAATQNGNHAIHASALK